MPSGMAGQVWMRWPRFAEAGMNVIEPSGERTPPQYAVLPVKTSEYVDTTPVADIFCPSLVVLGIK